MCCWAQSELQKPAPPQKKSILLFGGTAHIGNGKIIKSAAVGFKDGKLNLVADATIIRIDRTQWDTIINFNGKHVYPAIIAPATTLGIKEISAVRASRDFMEVGAINPNVRSIIAYNAESRIIPTVRSNGILLAQVAPQGGLVSGTSSIVMLDAWNWEDAAYKIDDGIHLNWPLSFIKKGWWGNPGPWEENSKRKEEINKLYNLFSQARAYEKANHQEKNLRLESMRGLFTGRQRLFIHANYIKDIQDAIFFASRNGIQNLVIVGAQDALLAIDEIKKYQVSVILTRLHSLPSRDDDDIDIMYKLPSILQNEGVLFCLSYIGDMETMGNRNLPFTAGSAAAYGLSKEEALASITSNTAKILGIDHKTGTLENGKDANLFLSSGDALDMNGNNIELAFIQGRQIDLENNQKMLYRKYNEKYGTDSMKD